MLLGADGNIELMASKKKYRGMQAIVAGVACFLIFEGLLVLLTHFTGLSVSFGRLIGIMLGVASYFAVFGAGLVAGWVAGIRGLWYGTIVGAVNVIAVICLVVILAAFYIPPSLDFEVQRKATEGFGVSASSQMIVGVLKLIFSSSVGGWLGERLSKKYFKKK